MNRSSQTEVVITLFSGHTEVNSVISSPVSPRALSTRKSM